MSDDADVGVYPGLASRARQLDGLAQRLGTSVVEPGLSVQGRPLRAVVVPSTGETTATVFVGGNLHGVEWIGERCAMGVLRAFVDDGPLRTAADALRARASVVVLPTQNPDGVARTARQRGIGTLKELRTNAHGVDLNRNFPMPHGARPSWIPTAGSDDVDDATWRGPDALSEPEARAIDALATTHRFTAAVGFHSFMGTLIPPKVETADDAAGYRALAAAFQGGEARVSSTWPSMLLMNRFVDVYTGELEDHLHHAHGCWAVCVEVFPVWASVRQHVRAPSLFARFQPQDPAPYVDKAVAGTLAYLRAALDRPRPSSRARLPATMTT